MSCVRFSPFLRSHLLSLAFRFHHQPCPRIFLTSPNAFSTSFAVVSYDFELDDDFICLLRAVGIACNRASRGTCECSRCGDNARKEFQASSTVESRAGGDKLEASTSNGTFFAFEASHRSSAEGNRCSTAAPSEDDLSKQNSRKPAQKGCPPRSPSLPRQILNSSEKKRKAKTSTLDGSSQCRL